MDKKPNVKSLKPTAFAGMMAARLKAVAAASDAPVPDLYDYPANRLARELHPAVQFLKVEAIDAHSPDMKTYTLAPDKAKGTTSLAWFSAGQYLVLGVNVDGKFRSRPYSISSSPAETLEGHYRLTVKRVPGGAVMAALGILESMLGFNQNMLTLMIALYIAQDSFGTACNVTGDGAIAMLMNAITGKKASKA